MSAIGSAVLRVGCCALALGLALASGCDDDLDREANGADAATGGSGGRAGGDAAAGNGGNEDGAPSDREEPLNDAGCPGEQVRFYVSGSCNSPSMCGGPAFDACVLVACDCNGQTVSIGCGISSTPFQHISACEGGADAESPDAGAD
jgi:hypothetical protein